MTGDGAGVYGLNFRPHEQWPWATVMGALIAIFLAQCRPEQHIDGVI